MAWIARCFTLSSRLTMLIVAATVAFGAAGAYLAAAQPLSREGHRDPARRRGRVRRAGLLRTAGAGRRAVGRRGEGRRRGRDPGDAHTSAPSTSGSTTFTRASIMHPVNAALVGRDVSTFADPNGKLIYMEAVALARSSGGGHMEYMWPKPGETEPKQKLSYVKLYPRWNWVIGSGIHVEDVREQAWRSIAAFLGVAIAGDGRWRCGWRAARSGPCATRRVRCRPAPRQVVAAAEQVAGAAQSLSLGATEQAASLQQTSASTEELAATTRQNAERSRQSADLVRAVERSVGDANGALSSMARSMARDRRLERAGVEDRQDDRRDRVPDQHPRAQRRRRSGARRRGGHGLRGGRRRSPQPRAARGAGGARYHGADRTFGAERAGRRAASSIACRRRSVRSRPA